jgi:hypothetical protein
MNAADVFLPVAFSGTTWTAVGSIGTAIAVLVALGSLLFELRGRQRAEVARIREQVQTTAIQIRQFVPLIEDSAPLMDAAWRTALSVRAQAGSDPTANEMRAVIGQPVVALTAAVEGWATSPASDQLQQALASLSATGNLTGHLSLLSPPGELLREIVRDGYSSWLFVRLLGDFPAQKFVSEHQEDDINALTRALTEHLQGNASLYFRVRYESALREIVAFVNTAATALIALKPRNLIHASRAKTTVSVEASFTQQLREGLAGLADTLPAEVVSSLQGKIDRIESSIDKETAEAQLESDPKQPDNSGQAPPER